MDSLSLDTSFSVSKKVGEWVGRAPLVAECAPHHGPLAGGTVITITGAHLGGGDLTVEIGGARCTGVAEVKNSRGTVTAIRCTTPAFVAPAPASPNDLKLPVIVKDIVVQRPSAHSGTKLSSVSIARFSYVVGSALSRSHSNRVLSVRLTACVPLDATAFPPTGVPPVATNNIKFDAKRGKAKVPLRALYATVVNQLGFLVGTELIPNDEFKHSGKIIGGIMDIVWEATHDIYKLPTIVSVDDGMKLRFMFVLVCAEVCA